MFHQKPFLGQQINWAHPLAKGLVACWMMNEGSGDFINDLSKNGNDGIISGAIWESTRSGLGLSFDGSNDYVNCGDIPINAIPALTISFWMNQRVLNQTDFIFYKSTGSNPNMMRIFTHTNAYMYAEVNGDLQRGLFLYNSTIPANSWHHVVVVFDGSGAANVDKLKVYVDTEQMTLTLTGTIGTTTANATGQNAHIGYSSNAFDGKISNFFIYNRVLTPSEIAWLYREPYGMFEWSKLWYMYGAAVGATMAGHYYRTLMQGTGY